MKKNLMISLTFAIALTVLMVTGCQPSEAKSVDQEALAQETVVQEPVVQEPTDPKEVETVPKEEPKPAKEGDKETPKIVVTKKVHDFGEVGPGSSSTASYEFANEGKATLLVKRIQSTCGCSKPTLIKGDKRFPMPIKDPVALEPGETGQIEVTYKSGM